MSDVSRQPSILADLAHEPEKQVCGEIGLLWQKTKQDGKRTHLPTELSPDLKLASLSKELQQLLDLIVSSSSVATPRTDLLIVHRYKTIPCVHLSYTELDTNSPLNEVHCMLRLALLSDRELCRPTNISTT